ncbi:hypothetical protein SETIT_5G111100v2 [Setaria italica]|uniref:Uncharacterized protein n=1 Tax=Setaria italica TaxID=4555 RepID=A0A368R3H8_SETIT|nr:hypothetical protein SETIT_5G111100v2 [Setaria italica]
MAAAAPWTVRFRVRALEAEGRCDEARWLLRGAVALLELPMHVTDAPATRAQSQHVVAALSDAGSGLATAAATTAAAEFLALRAAAADPTAPLPSVADIPDAHQAEPKRSGHALGSQGLRRGCIRHVGWCCDRLLAANNCWNTRASPRDAAHGYLVIAENLAGVSAADAYTALCFMFPHLDREF